MYNWPKAETSVCTLLGLMAAAVCSPQWLRSVYGSVHVRGEERHVVCDGTAGMERIVLGLIRSLGFEPAM